MKTKHNLSEAFIGALRRRDVKTIRRIPKSDLHSHWLYAARLAAFEKYAGHHIPPPPRRMNTIEEMVGWTRRCLWSIFDSRVEHHQFALAAAFRQAKLDGVVVLEMSVDAGICADIYKNNADSLARSLRKTHRKIAPDITFVPELSIKGQQGIPYEFLESCFATGYFGSIDLYAVEDLGGKYEDYRKIFRMAKKAGLKLKAHVGEFGPARLVQHAVEILDLEAVQHGINAAESPAVIRWLAKHNIQLNICPTSNLMLRRVNSMKNHPIAKLHRNGVKVTVNTDDLVIFGQSVSDEFLNLYKARVLTAEELDVVRLNGLSQNDRDCFLFF